MYLFTICIFFFLFLKFNFIFLIYFLLLFFFTLQYCIGFAIHQHESATSPHKVSHSCILIFFPSSLTPENGYRDKFWNGFIAAILQNTMQLLNECSKSLYNVSGEMPEIC